MTKQKLILLVLLVIAVGSVVYYQAFQKNKAVEYTGSLDRVTISEAGQPTTGLVYIALKKGFFKDQGLDVVLKHDTSGRASMASMLGGEADFATSADTPIVQSIMRGDKIYILATVGTSDSNTGIVGRRDRGILTIADLAGKKIGVTIGSSAEFLLDTILTYNSVAKDKISIVDFKPEEMSEVLTTGEVDAVVIWNPHMIKLQKELGDSGVVFHGSGLYTETQNLVVMQDFVNNNPDKVEKVIRALNLASDFVKKNNDEAESITAEYLNINKADLYGVWSKYYLDLKLDQSLPLTLENESIWAINKGLFIATESPNFLEYIYTDILRTVNQNAVSIIK